MMRRHKKIFLMILLPITAFALLWLALAPTVWQAAPQLDDEFNDATTLSEWFEGPSTAYDLLDINTSNPGQLTFVPTRFDNNGWYAGYIAPLRYKLVSDNFAAVTSVKAGNINNPNSPATGAYNSAGWLLRDPSSDTTGQQNYVMFNVGFQAAELATEVKTTVNSTSILTLTSSANSYQGQLLLCRVDETIYFYRQLDNESQWVHMDTIHRPDFPATMQVGLMVNGWRNSDLYAQFDYARFVNTDIATPSDCLAAFNTPTAIALQQMTIETAHPLRVVLMATGLLWVMMGIGFARRATRVRC